MAFNNQVYQHRKEDLFLNLLFNQYPTAIDAHNNFKCGYDFIIRGRKLDAKVSNSRKLTLIRKYKDHIYCPLTEHQDVDILYCIEFDDCYKCYRFTKKEILEHFLNNFNNLSSYEGDGNKAVNITLPAEWFLVREPFIIVRK